MWIWGFNVVFCILIVRLWTEQDRARPADVLLTIELLPVFAVACPLFVYFNLGELRTTIKTIKYIYIYYQLYD